MKKIDPHKPTWDNNDWIIYLNNLDLLCENNNLLKKELSKKAGVVNAFRTDAGRPSQETMKNIATAFNVDVDWLLTHHDRLTANVNEPAPSYAPHGGCAPDAQASLGIAKGSEQWRAFAMLSQIYASEDQALIRAIYSNLCAFAESAERKRENAELKRDVEALQARLNEVVVQLDQKGIVHLNDRRSGVERRVDPDPHAPDGHDRRSGHDRRKAAPG